MKIIQFRGHSDDTFGWDEMSTEGVRSGRGDDHDDCAEMKVRAFRVASESTGAAAIVTGVYGKCPAAVWSIGIAPDEEDVALPAWAAMPRFTTDGYTPVLALIVPDDTRVQLACVDGKCVDGKDAADE